jgi:hypothetical protein
MKVSLVFFFAEFFNFFVDGFVVGRSFPDNLGFCFLQFESCCFCFFLFASALAIFPMVFFNFLLTPEATVSPGLTPSIFFCFCQYLFPQFLGFLQFRFVICGHFVKNFFHLPDFFAFGFPVAFVAVDLPQVPIEIDVFFAYFFGGFFQNFFR